MDKIGGRKSVTGALEGQKGTEGNLTFNKGVYMLSMEERARREGYYTMAEAASKAGVCYRTLRRYIQQGRVYPRVESHPDALGYRYWLNDGCFYTK